MKHLIHLAVTALMLTPALSHALLSKDECEQIYNAARDTCAKTFVACSKVTQCKTLRETCDADLSTRTGCEALIACAKTASPVLYGSQCRYAWKADDRGGRCVNTNYPAPMEQISYMCPGFVRNQQKNDRDPDFNCRGQITHFNGVLPTCKKAIQNYFLQCPDDVARVRIQFSECPEAEAPVPSR